MSIEDTAESGSREAWEALARGIVREFPDIAGPLIAMAALEAGGDHEMASRVYSYLMRGGKGPLLHYFELPASVPEEPKP